MIEAINHSKKAQIAFGFLQVRKGGVIRRENK